MHRIRLTQEQTTLIDLDDYIRVDQYSWSYHKSGYACAKVNSKHTKLHRFILQLEVGDKRSVDHINGDKLDNRKSNLRICTHSQNTKNRSPNTNGKSTYKGVDYQKRTSTWRARIRVDYKHIYLGDYRTELEAALAYNKAAKEYHGDYAKLNEIKETK
jgi:hypothetical protein